ncbi:hypothetical protein CMI37_22870 [Candidatus Pacearchaeota archaeon]|nr:hypothetical protein [Candidatus Pacearchaeota archaeon]
MANKDAAFGLRPVRILGGSTYSGAFANPYYFNSSTGTDIFIGDPVKLNGTNTANSSAVGDFGIGTLQDIVIATAGDFFLGVVVAFEPNRSNLELQYRPASTERIAYVCDHPWMVYHVQEDSDGNSMPVTDSGLNVDFVAGAGSTVTGLSAYELDSDSAATTATLNFRILQLANIADNEIGNHAVWEVMPNQQQYREITGGA